MKNTAQGKFEVQATPQPSDELSQSVGVMRMRFEKRFEGPLQATSVVSMTGIFDQELDSGGYVAIERLTGSLDGKKGSFYLQHSSTMSRGTPAQHIVVIPDSGTEELKGLAGKMTIDIHEDGAHFYTLEYEIK